MQKTKIEWVRNPDGTQGYSWNPVVGCWGPRGSKGNPRWCSYCYARKIATRFKGTKTFPNGFEPVFHWNRLNQPKMLKKPSTIFVCSMAEIFGDWVRDDWVEWIFNTIAQCPQHTFIILTKCPENFHKFILSNVAGDNVWFGITVTGTETIHRQKIMLRYLNSIIAKIKFISFEPLLNKIGPEILDDLDFIDWIIIGAQTNPLKLPEKEWVEEILDYCRRQTKSVFMKDNLGKKYRKLIQEFPIDRKNIDRK